MSKKRKIKAASNVIDFCLPDQPQGEDFFVFSVFLDDPDSPTWNHGQTIFGTWTQSKDAASFLINLWASSKPKGQLRVAMFQGDHARAYLKDAFQQELRYQQERKAIPNN